jgi:hypothetical protein
LPSPSTGLIDVRTKTSPRNRKKFEGNVLADVTYRITERALKKQELKAGMAIRDCHGHAAFAYRVPICISLSGRSVL